MRHHEQTIAGFTDHHAALPDTMGVVVVGSVARGEERPDSDVDVYLVVTDDAYAAAGRAGAIAYVSHTGVTYDGGYVDVKLASPGYLQAAVDHGDDPTRASFDRGQVTFDRTAGLRELLTRMTDLPDEAWAQRVYSLPRPARVVRRLLSRPSRQAAAIVSCSSTRRSTPASRPAGAPSRSITASSGARSI